MKIEVVRVSRRPPWPLWAVLLAVVWLALGGAAMWLGIRFGWPVQLCLFKRLAGFACPTCGFARGALNLLEGNIIQAWLCNPLLYSLLGVFAVSVAARLFLARSVRVHLSRAERTLAWVIAIAIFFANWMYVIFCVG